MIGFMFGLKNCLCVYTYIDRQAGFFLGGFAQALPGVEGVSWAEKCTMDPGCGPKIMLSQGQKNTAKKLQSKLQKERHIHQGRGGKGGWGGVRTLVSRCGWEGQRIHGKVTVRR